MQSCKTSTPACRLKVAFSSMYHENWCTDEVSKRSFPEADELALAWDLDSLETCPYLRADSSDLTDDDQNPWAVRSRLLDILLVCDCWPIFSGLWI